MADGWTTITGASRYTGRSKNTVRQWFKHGLRYSKLPFSGSIEISFKEIDRFLKQFEVDSKGQVVPFESGKSHHESSNLSTILAESIQQSKRK